MRTSDYLDGNYAAFGMVLGGLDTVDVIASVPTDSNDKPRTEQVMRTVYVETYGKDVYLHQAGGLICFEGRARQRAEGIDQESSGLLSKEEGFFAPLL